MPRWRRLVRDSLVEVMTRVSLFRTCPRKAVREALSCVLATLTDAI